MGKIILLILILVYMRFKIKRRDPNKIYPIQYLWGGTPHRYSMLHGGFRLNEKTGLVEEIKTGNKNPSWGPLFLWPFEKRYNDKISFYNANIVTNYDPAKPGIGIIFDDAGEKKKLELFEDTTNHVRLKERYALVAYFTTKNNGRVAMFFRVTAGLVDFITAVTLLKNNGSLSKFLERVCASAAIFGKDYTTLEMRKRVTEGGESIDKLFEDYIKKIGTDITGVAADNLIKETGFDSISVEIMDIVPADKATIDLVEADLRKEYQRLVNEKNLGMAVNAKLMATERSLATIEANKSTGLYTEDGKKRLVHPDTAKKWDSLQASKLLAYVENPGTNATPDWVSELFNFKEEKEEKK